MAQGAKLAAALGFFDGVHMGHAALLHRAVEAAGKLSLVPAVITLDRYPAAALGGGAAPLINSAEDRERLIKLIGGIDRVITLRFDRELRQTPWEDYAAALIERFGCGALVCGYDHRFGAGGEGTAERLREFAAARGVECIVVPRVDAPDGRAVRSTAIRELIMQGDMRGAGALLGHPHLIGGTVVHGRQLGHTLGIPTANLTLGADVVRPAFGVYAARMTVRGRTFDGVTNIGVKPTVAGAGEPELTVETHLLDFEGDIYGESAELWLFERLRPEQKFAGLEELSRQMHTDAENARKILINIPRSGKN